ncbi:MAG TPA: hypothetical protein VEK34_13505 [Methylocella sp.]|nr:hypothetical protein [Methylocella sp.]
MPGGLNNPYSPSGSGPAQGGSPSTYTATTGQQGTLAASPTSYPGAARYKYSCTIGRNEPDAGDACELITSATLRSGARCKCGRQSGTID